ncbi:MAG: DUF1761 domain-containing protein [Bauldia sp.]
MSFSGINYIAVIIAAIAGFGVGALWYSVLFVKPWMDAMGMNAADMNARRASGDTPAMAPLLGGSIVGNLVMAFILAALLRSLGVASIASSVGTAFLVWLGFVVTVMGVNNSFGGRKPMLTVIDGGHWLVVLLVMGAIIGAFG